jgi:DNA topoisomerase-2
VAKQDQEGKLNIPEFFNTDFTSYSTYASFRGLGNFIDGAKPSSRKVINSVKNLKDKTKVASLAARIVDTLEYLHGQVSLEGVISGMAQDYPGSNNINLLEPKGDFGSVCIQKAGASRYIYVDKEKIYDSIFKSIDENILIEQEFEGTRIEPQFYVPVIPMILVNGSEGIGTGFAQKILSRNPIEIIDYLIDLNERHSVSMDKQCKTPYLFNPHFKGFTGQIKRVGDTFSYEIYGKFERTNSTTINITELPLGYDLEKYCTILAKLEDDKVITDFTDKSEPKENKFHFEIKAQREFVKKDDEYIIDKLKLVRKVTENFTCIGKNNEIVEFETDKQILDEYIQIRLEYYQKRKDYLIAKIKTDLFISGSKFYFVKFVLEDKIKVFKQSKADIIAQVEANTDFPFYKVNDSFNYLINMAIHSFTSDTIAELKEDIQKKKLQLKEITDISINMMWLQELRELKKALK